MEEKKEKIGQIIKNLEKLPLEINACELQLIEFNQKITEIQEKIKTLEQQMYMSVSSVTDPETNKLVYSNEKKREIETKSRLNFDPEYNLLNEELGRVQIKSQKEKIELNFLINKFKSLKLIVLALQVQYRVI